MSNIDLALNGLSGHGLSSAITQSEQRRNHYLKAAVRDGAALLLVAREDEDAEAMAALHPTNQISEMLAEIAIPEDKQPALIAELEREFATLLGGVDA